jgi:hypothetical protein
MRVRWGIALPSLIWTFTACASSSTGDRCKAVCQQLFGDCFGDSAGASQCAADCTARLPFCTDENAIYDCLAQVDCNGIASDFSSSPRTSCYTSGGCDSLRGLAEGTPVRSTALASPPWVVIELGFSGAEQQCGWADPADVAWVTIDVGAPSPGTTSVDCNPSGAVLSTTPSCVRLLRDGGASLSLSTSGQVNIAVADSEHIAGSFEVTVQDFDLASGQFLDGTTPLSGTFDAPTCLQRTFPSCGNFGFGGGDWSPPGGPFLWLIAGYLRTRHGRRRLGRCVPPAVLLFPILLMASSALAAPVDTNNADTVDGREWSTGLVFWPTPVFYQHSDNSGFIHDSPQQIQDETSSFAYGFRATYGFWLTDFFELGIGSSFGNVVVGSATIFELGVETFLKLNLRTALHTGPFNPFVKLGPFAELNQLLGGAAGVGLDLGVELRLTPRVGLTASVPVALSVTSPLLCCAYDTVRVGAALGILYY